jgi:hypothetical protein
MWRNFEIWKTVRQRKKWRRMRRKEKKRNKGMKERVIIIKGHKCSKT